MHKGIIVRCKRCGRRLTNEKSMLLGYGMTCWLKRFRVVPLDEWGIIKSRRKKMVDKLQEVGYNKHSNKNL